MKIKNSSNVDVSWSNDRVQVKAGETAEIDDDLAVAAMRVYPFLDRVPEPKPKPEPKKEEPKKEVEVKKEEPKKEKKEEKKPTPKKEEKK